MDKLKHTTATEVNFIEPLTWLKEDGTLSPIKRMINPQGFCVLEHEGQCYVIYPQNDGRPCINGLLFAIKEKFDDLEGEEIKAGGNASEQEGVRPAE